MKNFKLIGAIVIAAMTMQSCQNEEKSVSLAQKQTEKKSEVSADIVDKLSSMYVNTKGIKKVDFLLPNGSTQPMYQVEGDINLTEEQILDLYAKNGPNSKNYRTYNLVRKGSVIKVLGYTGGKYALSRKEKRALQRAVQNYNRLNLTIRFKLSFGRNENSSDMVVYHNPNNRGSGGSAGFPSNGKPNKYIQIYGTSRLNTNVVTHLITHEMGHSVGFRHMDWSSRRSCGQNSNEGSAGVGAILIPGTTRNYDPTSVMAACFNGRERGRFNRNDKIALKYLYGRRRR